MPPMENYKRTNEKLTKLLGEEGDYLQNQLMFAGMQLLLIEYLKDWMKGHLEAFLGRLDGSNKKGEYKYTINEEHVYLFKKDKNGHPFDKQLNWFVDMDLIDEAEAAYLIAMLQRRNYIGHELLKLIVDDNHQELMWEECKAISNLLFKLDNGWFREVEVPTGLLDDHKEIPEEALQEGATVATIMLLHFVDKIKPRQNV